MERIPSIPKLIINIIDLFPLNLEFNVFENNDTL